MSLTTYQLAIGISSIFVPIMLYDLGYSLQQISLFFVFFFGIRMLVQFPTFNYIRKYGVNHSLALGYILTGFYILSVYIAQWHSVGLILAGFFGGLFGPVLWSSRHVDLVRVFASKKMSKDVTYMFVLNTLAVLLAPIIGGLVSEYAGPGYALLLTFVVLMAAVSIIHREIHSEYDLQAEKIPPVKFRLPSRDLIANMSNGIASNSYKLWWPLYVFIIVGSFSDVGFLFAIGTLISIPMIKAVGRYNERHGPYTSMTVGSMGRAVISSLRPLADSFGSVLAINLSFDPPDTARAQSFFDIYYRHAQKRSNQLGYIRAMEIFNNLGSTLSCLLLFILIPIVGDIDALKIIMLTGAIGALTTNLINHK